MKHQMREMLGSLRPFPGVFCGNLYFSHVFFVALVRFLLLSVLLRFSASEDQLLLSASAHLIFRFSACVSRTNFCHLPRSVRPRFLANTRNRPQQEARPKEHLVVSRPE